MVCLAVANLGAKVFAPAVLVIAGSFPLPLLPLSPSSNIFNLRSIPDVTEAPTDPPTERISLPPSLSLSFLSNLS